MTDAVSQIDIVPTLSLLLGLPIPFSNLGSVIPELFPSNGSKWKHLTVPPEVKTDLAILEALKINAVQVKYV